MTVSEALAGRQSIKSYLDKPVEQEKLEAVLRAGVLAPSAMNKQERKFVVVKDQKLRDRLVAEAGMQPMIAQAPAVIAVCATESEFIMPCGLPAFQIDNGIAGAYIMLAAYEQGLGSCWLGVFDEAAVKRVLGVPDDVRVVTLIPVGYHDGTQERKPRKGMDEVVSYDRY